MAMDLFTQGLMLGRVLELTEHTADKVEKIEARQDIVINRLSRLEYERSRRSSPKKVLLALGTALAAGFANLKAEQIAQLVTALLGRSA
jgi:hypothetical protein